MRLVAAAALMGITYMDWANSEWEPSLFLQLAFTAALLGITGRDAVELLKDRFGGGK